MVYACVRDGLPIITNNVDRNTYGAKDLGIFDICCFECRGRRGYGLDSRIHALLCSTTHYTGSAVNPVYQIDRVTSGTTQSPIQPCFLLLDL
jgi:hypothetical protein